ncbi:MAG TPA: hypothetical protein VFC99_18440 [Acidimicrobiia bacterium]|nr:hypothetical protein [Acidimicrobiia bacterium]
MNARPDGDDVHDEPEPEPDPPLRELDATAPEADVIEQHQPIDEDGGERGPDAFPTDVPEADALEQATPVPPDDDRWE